MEYVKRYLTAEYDFLHVAIYDEEDEQSLILYTDEKNVIIGINDLPYLSRFKAIERLIITSGEAPANASDILRTLHTLRELKLEYEETEPNTPWCLDISVCPRLAYLFSRSSYNFKRVSDSQSLKTLVVLNWYDEDLSRLKHASIDSFSICSGKLKTLKGIEDVPLVILSLSNLRNLTDISCVEKLPLKILEIENCNRVASLEEMSSDTIEYLMIYGKNKMTSGWFIQRFKQLKRVMLDIAIEDGDLSAFDGLEKAVILTDRKHFNRTNAQLPKSECPYRIETIPTWRYIYSSRYI